MYRYGVLQYLYIYGMGISYISGTPGLYIIMVMIFVSEHTISEVQNFSSKPPRAKARRSCCCVATCPHQRPLAHVH